VFKSRGSSFIQEFRPFNRWASFKSFGPPLSDGFNVLNLPALAPALLRESHHVRLVDVEQNINEPIQEGRIGADISGNDSGDK
jgi:hypothetical protein